MGNFYKFLNAKDVSYVLQQGTIIVSNLSYFRDLEATAGRGVGDRLEGATELVAPDECVLTEGSDALAAVNAAHAGFGLFETFAAVSGGGVIDVSGTKFVHVVPALYIYSFCEGDPDLLHHSSSTIANGGYDACLRIKSPYLLLKAVMDDGYLLELEAPAIEHFEGGRIDRVTYGEVSLNVLEGRGVAPSPFLKDGWFRGDNEHRIVLFPRHEIAPSRLTVRIPEPQRFFELIEMPTADGATT